MSSRMAAARKQSQQTWLNLHSRLWAMPFNYSGMFPAPVGEYIKANAVAISSCEGYLFNSLLATIGFLLSQNCSVSYDGILTLKPKLYIVFVGPPSTSKRQAIKTACLDPMEAIAHDSDTELMIVGKSTSAHLLQKLSEADKGAMLVSSEIYDVLHKMIKNGGESGLGDISMLSQIFSSKRVTVNYATQTSIDISADTPFGILGAMEPSPTALLLTALDSGNGFIERLILTFPDCLRPSPSETRTAQTSLRGKPSLTDVIRIVSAVGSSGTEYTFDEDAESELDRINEAYIKAINAAIVHRLPPPPSKRFDLVLRVAPALHVLTSIMAQLLEGIQPTPPTRTISKSTLDRAIDYVDFCDSQKETFLCELRNLTT